MTATKVALLVGGGLAAFVLAGVAIRAWTDLEPLLGWAGATLALGAYVVWFGWHVLDWDLTFEDWLEERHKSKRRR